MNLLYILIVLQLLDILTTILCLRTGKAYEANKFLAKLFDVIGMVPTLILIKGAFIGILLWAAPQVAPVVLWVGAAGYCWVIYNNLRVLRQLKAKK